MNDLIDLQALYDNAVKDATKMILALQAELAALRPLANMCKMLLAQEAWIKWVNLTPFCFVCGQKLSGEFALKHPKDTDCPIPALLAQLEKL